MPWVDVNSCNGCGTCVEECPAEAISMIEDKAEIDMSDCIRCGVCHEVCPQESVRHDSEKVPELIEMNVETTKRYMGLCAELLHNEDERSKCLRRMIKHYTKEKLVAEKTLEELQKLE